MFNLPPETKDRTVTVTIPKEVDPYFKEWYLETKNAGETPPKFAYRMLAKAGLAYHQHKVNNEAGDILKAQVADTQKDFDTAVLDAGL